MGKITCNVVRDLIPLYVDDVLSNDSKEIVENHIAECEGCKKYYSQLKDGATLTAERSRHDQKIIKSIIDKCDNNAADLMCNELEDLYITSQKNNKQRCCL